MVLVVHVVTLPDLDFHAAADDADAHGREEIVGGVGVEVDTAVEHGGRVLADTAPDHGLATGVVLDEVGNVVDDATDADETLAVLGALNVVVPFHDGELLERNTPVELGALLVELLLLLLDTALLDLVGTELLEVVGETGLLPEPDGPLGGVILVPLDSIAVVGWELVVEVVVTLAKSHKSGDQVVTRRVAIIEWLVAEPVSQRVDAEGGLLNEEDTEDTAVDETSLPVTPTETSDDSREDQTHEEDDLEVVTVLPDDNGIIVEIRNIGASNSLWVLLHEHPAEVGVEQTLADRVWVLVGVGVSVVCTVVTSPPSDGSLNSTSSDRSQENLERQSCRVGSVCPQTVVACCDTETGREVVGNCPNGSLCVERSPESCNASCERNADNQCDVEPIDVLVPVFPGHGRVGDVSAETGLVQILRN